jgi:hypothetical protein
VAALSSPFAKFLNYAKMIGVQHSRCVPSLRMFADSNTGVTVRRKPSTLPRRGCPGAARSSHKTFVTQIRMNST